MTPYKKHSSRTHCRRLNTPLYSSSICKFIPLAMLIQWTLLALMVDQCNVVGANLSPEIANDDSNPLGSGYGAKRNWKSLQGAWGKRSLDAGISAELTDADDDVYFAERRVPLNIGNGNNNNNVNNNHPDPVLRYSLVYLKNGAGILDRLLNGDSEENTGEQRFNENAPQYDLDDGESVSQSDNVYNEKRAWKSMNVAWGKRRSPPQWNKFRGAWGKREPGWNNLKGMWGKRSAKDWQKLHGSWGKRTIPMAMDTN